MRQFSTKLDQNIFFVERKRKREKNKKENDNEKSKFPGCSEGVWWKV